MCKTCKSLFIHHVVKLLQNHAGGILSHDQVSVYCCAKKLSGEPDTLSYSLFGCLVVDCSYM